MDTIKAPWNGMLAARLNEYQRGGHDHPYTCVNGRNARHFGREGVLVATVDGWVCPFCDYRQDWCHASHIESIKKANPEEELLGIWSNGEGYQGHASEELLLFFPDGTGRLEFVNWTLCSAHSFEWTISRPGVLSFHGVHTWQLVGPDFKSVAERPSTFNFDSIEYSTSEQQRPREIGLWILELQLAFEAPYPASLGLVTRSLTGRESPRFSL